MAEPQRHSERQPTGFGAQIPGMRTAPVEHVVRSKTRAEMAKNPEVWKQYNDLSRTIRIVNRAAKGPLEGKPFCAAVNGEMWPEGAAGDLDSWLQPGEYMDVPKDVALHICGNVWDPALPNRADVISRYGDWQYEEQPLGVAGKVAPMRKVGPPAVPDLVATEVDGRGKEKGDWKAIYDLYLREPVVKDVAVPA
jgi:hypothetical protein